MDYAGNNFNIYYPEVGQPRPDSSSVPVQVFCPACEFANVFWEKPMTTVRSWNTMAAAVRGC
nr:hypothetical protein [Aliamphritea spongicola]